MVQVVFVAGLMIEGYTIGVGVVKGAIAYATMSGSLVSPTSETGFCWIQALRASAIQRARPGSSRQADSTAFAIMKSGDPWVASAGMIFHMPATMVLSSSAASWFRSRGSVAICFSTWTRLFFQEFTGYRLDVFGEKVGWQR